MTISSIPPSQSPDPMSSSTTPKAIPAVKSSARIAKKLPVAQNKKLASPTAAPVTIDLDMDSSLPAVAASASGVEEPNFMHADIPSFVLEFQRQFRELNTRLSSQDSRLQQLESLIQENQRLKDHLAAAQAEIAQLKALHSSSSPSSSVDTTSGMDVDVPRDISTNGSKYADVAARPPAPDAKVLRHGKAVKSSPRLAAPGKSVDKRPPPPPSQKRIEASARIFRPVEGPQGYEYLYITRARNLSRTDVRRHLSRLGVDCGRLLDVSFPARSVLGLLVHLQYKPAVLEALNTAKIPLLSFNPLDPKHLGDSKYAELTDVEREHAAFAVNAQRCQRTLAHVRPSVVAGVARSFVSFGWLSVEDARQAISSPGSASYADAAKESVLVL
ncbi:unnamed protein product [Mucor hiemalis]